MTAVAQGARSMMTMRAFLTRNAVVTTDAYGHGDAPVFDVQATIPFRAWTKTRKDVVEGLKLAWV